MNSRRWRLPKYVLIPLVVFVLIATGVMLWQIRQAESARAEAKKAQQELERLRILPEMVEIPAGTFMIGSPDKEVGRGSHEGPRREVTIKPFLIGKYEVTFDEYAKFAKATLRQLPDDEGWDRGKRPVINVSWEDAVNYAVWLSRLTGERYRLPTEAEWEYAARANTTTAFSFGDDIGKLNEYAWYSDNSEGKTHPVGKKKPNAWGLYDMHGNVWEWVADDWHDNYREAPHDGRAWVDDPRGAYRVMRGGSWDYGAQGCRAAGRFYDRPSYRYDDFGFRLAKSVALGS
jgi:formylglycine-generating enzyme required for sulfatase activity